MEYIDITPCDETNAASAPIPASALQRTSYHRDEDEASCTWCTPNWSSYGVLFEDLKSNTFVHDDVCVDANGAYTQDWESLVDLINSASFESSVLAEWMRQWVWSDED
jgi:hypothetical protein